jgi:hypothetical protein
MNSPLTAMFAALAPMTPSAPPGPETPPHRRDLRLRDSVRGSRSALPDVPARGGAAENPGS